jgi:soluble lytic murein transglycosylase
MVRALELWNLGFAGEARLDFESLRIGFQDDPLTTYQLAVFYRDIGLYRSSILASGRLLDLANTSALGAPAFIARLRYPRYFSELVNEYASLYQLDPLFVFALIWQESAFEGFAVSSASAQGLMQIWPPTGEDIAARISWPNYVVTDLQRPSVSVAFGTWLLNDELQRFDGDRYAALAAYNAGTGQAADWDEASGGDPDLYYESISLSEPKRYIRMIYQHYAIYAALYGG